MSDSSHACSANCRRLTAIREPCCDIKKALRAVCRAAYTAGRIKRLPHLHIIEQPTATDPLTTDQLSLLFAAARHTPGYAGPVPLSTFMPALLAITLDTSAPLNSLMATSRDRFDRRLGVLHLDGQFHRLQPMSVESLTAVLRFLERRLLPCGPSMDSSRPTRGCTA